jgi:hypothetical protein
MTRVFRQGQVARFFVEFEVLEDIEAPIGGLIIRHVTGMVVHGKNTLQDNTEVPSWIAQGTRLRFRHEIALELGLGEYTFDVGFSTLSLYDYKNLDDFSQSELNQKVIRLCHLAGVGQFKIALGRDAARLLHHGLANLPGRCSVVALPPAHKDDRVGDAAPYSRPSRER